MLKCGDNITIDFYTNSIIKDNLYVLNIMCSSNQRFLCDKDCQICFNKSFASNPKSQYWSNRNEDTPRQIFKSAHVKRWFDCPQCGHLFISSLNVVSRGGWCIFCANLKLCDDINCETCTEKSFASNPKAEFWAEKNSVSPREVFKAARKKYWFSCPCGHDFDAALYSVMGGSFCPYCCLPPKKLCQNKECKECFNKSFQSYPKSRYWSEQNEVTPREVFKSSLQKFLFNCECGHEFDSKLDYVSSGVWCPYCSSPPKKLCSDIDCRQCWNKSFASSIHVKDWSIENKITPREVFKSSTVKFWFKCQNNHEYKSSLDDKTGHDSGCPDCKNKTETKLYKWLKTNNHTFISQVAIKQCKKQRRLKYDFLSEDFDIIIELDGPQHFRQISNWQSPEEAHDNDLFKTRKALENGYSVIRILQEDVLYDTNDWEDKLTKYLHEHDKPTCVFINNKNEYDKLRTELQEIKETEGLDFDIIYI